MEITRTATSILPIEDNDLNPNSTGSIFVVDSDNIGESFSVNPATSEDPISTITTSEDRIVQSVYQHLMESIAIDVAANLHEMIKTGADDLVPASWRLFLGTNTPTRRELYPELYNGNPNNETESVSQDSGGNLNEKPKNGDREEEITESETVNTILPSPKRKRISDGEIKNLLEKYAVDLPTTKMSISSSRDGRVQGVKEIIPNGMEDLSLLSKVKKEKAADHPYKDGDDDGSISNNDDDEEDEDDEDFKMEDADDNSDDDGEGDSNKKKNRSLSMSSSTTPSIVDPTSMTANGSAAEPLTSGGGSGINRPISIDIWGNMPSKEPKNRLCRCQVCGRLISTSRFASHLDKCMGLSTSRSGGVSSGSGNALKGGLFLSSSIAGSLGTKKNKRKSSLLN